MQAETTELIEESGRVAGVRALTPSGPLAVRAELIVGADGRHSVVRDRAGLRSTELGAPMDVLWFRLSRHPTDPDETMGRFGWTQRLQLVIQNRVITRVLAGGMPLHAPWPVRLLDRYPRLRRLPTRVLGIGFRPEHVRTPAVGPAQS